MLIRGRKVFPERVQYINGNIGIILKECELVPDDEGFIDPSPLTVLSVNTEVKIPQDTIWVRDDKDAVNTKTVPELVKQGYLISTGLIKPSGYIHLKQMRLSENFFEDEHHIQTVKEK